MEKRKNPQHKMTFHSLKRFRNKILFFKFSKECDRMMTKCETIPSNIKGNKAAVKWLDSLPNKEGITILYLECCELKEVPSNLWKNPSMEPQREKIKL